MHELMLMMAKVMPPEMLANDIKEAATEYLITKSPESLKKLTVFCVLLASKESMGERDVFEVSKELDEQKRIKERLNSEKVVSQ